MKRELFLTLAFFIAINAVIKSQSILTIASDGRNARSDGVMISAAEDIQEFIIDGVKTGLKPVNLTIAPDSAGGIYKTFFQLYNRLSVNEVAVILIAGPWNKINANPELSTFDSPFPDKITLDYLYNLLYYIKSECSFVFVVPPPQSKLSGFDGAVNWKNLDKNGKYLIIFDSDKSETDDLVSAIEDTFSDLADITEKLLEEKTQLLISDWVKLMASAGSKHGLNLLIHPVSNAKNPYMRLRENND